MRSESKRVATEALFVSGLAAISVLTGGGGAGLIGAVASSMAASHLHGLSNVALIHFRKEWLGEKGVRNHDIANALIRAFHQTLVDMQEEWQRQPAYIHLRIRDKDAASLTLDALKGMEEDADWFFQRKLGDLQQDDVEESVAAQAFIFDSESALRGKMNGALAAYFYGHDEHLVEYVQRFFLDGWLLRFGEELKDPGEDGTKAWRAYQRLWQDSLGESIAELQADVQGLSELTIWLQDWVKRLDSLPASIRDETGMEALTDSLIPISQRLDSIKIDTEAIRADTAILVEDVAELRKTIHGMIVQQEYLIITEPPAPMHPPTIVDFVGRTKELTYFANMLDNDGLAVISGMAGVGKTALAATLVGWVIEDVERVFWHSFNESDNVKTLLWKLAGFLAKHGRGGLWNLLEPSRLMGRTLPPTASLIDFLVQLMRGAGLLLCFDDYHLVDNDPGLNQLVERLNGMAGSDQVAIIITARRRPPFVPATKFVPLEGLRDGDAKRLLAHRDLLLTDEQFDTLYDRTAGNAVFITLAADALQQASHPDGILESLADAEDIESYLLAEVDDTLTGQERAVMEAVSILLGYAGTQDIIGEIVGRNVARVLRRLVERHLLSVQRDDKSSSYLLHDIIRAFYYDQLSRQQRRQLHGRAAEVYEREEKDSFSAALHYHHAQQNRRAAELATTDVLFHIHRGRAQALNRLLAALPRQEMGTDVTVKVQTASGHASGFLQEMEAAQSSFQAAWDILATLPATPENQKVKVEICRGMALTLRDRTPAEALQWVQRGLENTEQLDDPAAEADLQVQEGIIQLRLGDMKAAGQALVKSMQLAPVGDNFVRLLSLLNYGYVLYYMNDLPGSSDYMGQAQAMAEVLSDPFQELAICINLAAVNQIVGNWKSAETNVKRAENLAQELGNVAELSKAYLSDGVLSLKRGNNRHALAKLSQTLVIAREHDVHEVTIAALSYLAELRMLQHDLSEAHDLLVEAEQIATDQELKYLLPFIHLLGSQYHLAVGDSERAMSSAKSAIAQADKFGLKQEEGQALRCLGEVQLAMQQYKQASLSFQRGLELMTQNPFETARIQAAWGRGLLLHGDQQQGRDMLMQARNVFNHLGIGGDQDNVDNLLES